MFLLIRVKTQFLCKITDVQMTLIIKMIICYQYYKNDYAVNAINKTSFENLEQTENT